MQEGQIGCGEQVDFSVIDGWIEEWRDDGWEGGWMDEGTDGGWMERLMSGWMGEGIDVWIVVGKKVDR